MTDQMQPIDWLDYFLDLTIGYHDNHAECGDMLIEQIDKAHRRGAISNDVAMALYEHPEISYYINRSKY